MENTMENRTKEKAEFMRAAMIAFLQRNATDVADEKTHQQTAIRARVAAEAFWVEYAKHIGEEPKATPAGFA
jgi:hypothetical protein